MTDNTAHGPRLAVLLVVIQMLIYGVSNPLAKIAYQSMTPLCCLTIRFALALLILAAFSGRRTLRELRRAKPAAWLPASLCIAGAYITSNVAIKLTEVTTVGFLMSLPFLFTPLLTRLVLRRPYRPLFLLPQGLAVAGLYLLCASGGALAFGWGEALALLCALCMAGALVWSERGLSGLSPLAISTAQIAVTFVLSLAGALLFDGGLNFAAAAPAAWWITVFLAVFCSCVAYLLQNTALLYASANLVSLTQCLEPVFTASFSLLLLGEHLRGGGYLGAAILIVCIVWGNRLEARRRD